MPDLLPVPSRRPFLASRTERAIERTMRQIEAQARVAMQSDALRIEHAAAKTEHGLVAVAHVSAVEAALLPMVPHAERRLQQIADGGTLAIARIVMEA